MGLRGSLTLAVCLVVLVLSTAAGIAVGQRDGAGRWAALGIVAETMIGEVAAASPGTIQNM